jgi:signal transduction histidine kinase
MEKIVVPIVNLRRETALIRRQALASSALGLLAVIIGFTMPDFPFDKRILWLILGMSTVYLGTYLFLWKLLERYYRHMISALSFLALVVMGFVVHLSGGIVSPFVFMYFAVLISEAAYNEESTFSIVVAALSYLGAILGEYSGILPATNSFSAKVYASPITTYGLVTILVSLMVISGFLVKDIVSRLRRKVIAENAEKQAVIGKLIELDACSNIGMMTHRIIHDLRGPLAAISGHIEIERSSPGKTDEEKDALNDLSGMVSKMADSLRDITRFGRVSGGKTEKVEIKGFFKNLISILAFYRDARQVQFRQNCPDAGELFVMAVRQDLQQAYFNILKNAVEAVLDNTGDKIVEVSMRRAGAMLEVGITSNSRPIPEEILSKIFLKAVTGKSNGTGVGLMITHDLLRKNDINIEIKNVDGTGVLVATRMPLV